MLPHFFISLAIASGLSIAGAIAFSLFFARVMPFKMHTLHRLGFLLILGSGAESLALLFDADSYQDTGTVLSRIVLVLVTGLSLHAASAYQMRKKRESLRFPGK